MQDSSRTSNWLVPAVVSLIVIAFIVLAQLLLMNYEVVEKGKLLDYTDGFIYKIQIFGTYTFFVEPEVHRLDGDVFNSLLLSGIAFISLTYAYLLVQLNPAAKKTKPYLMYVILFFGMMFLAIDEFAGIHESLGHNMQFLASLPYIKRPDDAIIMSYLIPVGWFLFYFRKELLSCRGTLKAMTGVVISVVISSFADVLALPIEEFAELSASIFLVLAFLLLGASHVRQSL